MKKLNIRKYLHEVVGCVAVAAMVTATLIVPYVIKAGGADTELKDEYVQYCEEIGAEYGICPELLMAVIEQESGGDADAVGQAGEIGLMQIYPKWHLNRAEQLGVYNFFDPKGNILVGTDYLAELFAEYGDMGMVLMLYNGTSDAVTMGKNGIYTDYAMEVMERSEELERLHEK